MPSDARKSNVALHVAQVLLQVGAQHERGVAHAHAVKQG